MWKYVWAIRKILLHKFCRRYIWKNQRKLSKKGSFSIFNRHANECSVQKAAWYMFVVPCTQWRWSNKSVDKWHFWNFMQSIIFKWLKFKDGDGQKCYPSIRPFKLIHSCKICLDKSGAWNEMSEFCPDCLYGCPSIRTVISACIRNSPESK